ncbi:MAG: methyltransferase [Candidatus Nanohaloarchaeota archaeon QJJ-5]|nr:methyltransferase [Candidatus Nanohaloarchaeota archaeon QJJ-5]
MPVTFFDDLKFQIPKGLYVPREDSYLAAAYLDEQQMDGEAVLDMGTGCGFLGLIASANGADVDAVDINPMAIEVTKQNAERNDLTIDAWESDLFDDVDEPYDRIIFNAPYIPGSRDDRSDEQLAWYGGEDGRAVIEEFIQQASTHLNEGGELVIVQSSMTGIEKTRTRLEEHGFEPTIVREKKVSWEKIVVIAASKI